MVEKIVISTLMGDTEFDLGELVPVYVNGDKYVSKRAEGIVEGDQVVYDREYARIDYAEAESLFLKDEDVNAAKRALFEEHNGKFFALLRTFLVRGARQKANETPVSQMFHNPSPLARSGHESISGWTDESLEMKLFETGFNRPEVSFMKKLVKQTLDNVHAAGDTPIRSAYQIGKWLGHKESEADVIAPSDWAIFGALAQISPEFEKFYADYEKRGDLTGREAMAVNRYHKYKFYVGFKTAISKCIAIQVSADQEDREDHDPEFRYLTYLIRNKVAGFVRSVGKRHSSPVVLSVARRDGPAEPGLEKGVLSVYDITEELELDQVNVNYFSDFNIVLSALTGVIYSYVSKHKKYGDLSYEAYRELVFSVQDFYSDVRHTLGHINRKTVNPVKGIPVDDQIRMVKELVLDIQDGKVDEALGFNGPYAFDLVAALNTIERAQPKVYQDYMNLNAEDAPKRGSGRARRREHRLASMEVKLRQDYGYEMKKDIPEEKKYSDYALHLKAEHDPLQLAQAREIPIAIDGGWVHIYDRYKISECLRKFGLNAFTRFTDISAYDGSCFK